MIASGSASSTALRTAPGSSRSRVIASAPSERTRSALSRDVEVPITSWPRSANLGTSRVPIAPLAPATKTRIMCFLSVWVGPPRQVAGAECIQPTPCHPANTASDARLRLRQAAADGVASQVHPVAHPKLVEDVRAVTLDGLVADHKQLCDLPARVALGDQLDDLGLACGQRVLREFFALRRTLQVVPDERLHRARVDEGLAAHRGAAGLHQIAIRDRLQDVSGRARAQRLEEVALVVVH